MKRNFWLNGYVNKQKLPHLEWKLIHKCMRRNTVTPRNRYRLVRFYGAGESYFFKNDEGHNVTVNGD
ncbi:hypothetical protein TNCV_1276381, partial [Trichonephila clavipes]